MGRESSKMKRTRMNDSGENQNLPWYLQSFRDGSDDDDEWVIRRFNNKPDSITINEESTKAKQTIIPLRDFRTSLTSSFSSSSSSSSSSYIDQHPEEFIVLTSKRITKRNPAKIHDGNTILWTQQNNYNPTRDFIVSLVYLIFLFYGLNHVRTVMNYLRSKLWSSTNIKSSSLHPRRRRPKRHIRPRPTSESVPMMDKHRYFPFLSCLEGRRDDAVGEVVSSTHSHGMDKVNEEESSTIDHVDNGSLEYLSLHSKVSLSTLSIADDTAFSSMSRPLECIDDDDDDSILIQSLPPSLREEGMSPSLDYTSPSPITNMTLPSTQRFKQNIEAISSVLLSSGLNRQSSLEMASQTVLRKLEMDYEYTLLQNIEKTKLWMKAQWRMEDRLIEEMKQLSHQWDNAYLRLRQTACSLFPGYHFLLCILLSLLSHLFRYHWKDIILNSIYGQTFSIDLKTSLNYLYVEVLCECRKDTRSNNSGPAHDAVSHRYWGSYSSIPTLSAVIYYSAPSTSCLFLCLIRTVCFTFIIFTTHCILNKLYVPYFIHQGLNTAIVIVVMARHVKSFFFPILGWVALANTSIALVGVVMSYRNLPDRDKLQTKCMKTAIKALDRNIILMFSGSTLIAILLGLLI